MSSAPERRPERAAERNGGAAPDASGSADDASLMREIAVRFAYLRRVVLAELTRTLAEHGITPPASQILFRLATESGQLPQQELVLDAGLDAAGVSRLIAKMAEQKLLTTKVDPKDRRRRLVRITAKGRRLHEFLTPIVDDAVRRVVVGLTPGEERQLLALLDKTVEATRELHAAGD